MAKTPPEMLEALFAQAEAGGGGASLAARRAAALAERLDPPRALAAWALAARLEPLDPAPLLARARLLAEAGDIGAAKAEASVVLREAVDQAARARAALLIGDLARAEGARAEARARYQEAMRIEEALLALDRSDPIAARWFARARGRLAELDAGEHSFDAARAGAEGALAMLLASAAQIGEPPVLAADIADAEMRLAALELDDARPASARRRLGEAIGRYERLGAWEPHEPHWPAALSDAWMLAAEADYARGAGEEAREAMDKALRVRLVLTAHNALEAAALVGTWRTRAALLAALGDNGAAADSLAQARALGAQIAAAGDEAGARLLTHTLLDQADHALRTGALSLAREAADEARARAETFARAGDGAWAGETGACWDRLGEIARAARAPEKAQEAFARAAAFRRLAHERAPDEGRRTRLLAAALLKLGDAALEANAPEAARAALNESIALRLKLAQAAPEKATAAHALAAALERMGFAALACGDAHAARGAWEDELALAERIFAAGDLEGERFRAIVESHLAGLGEADSPDWRASALARLDDLARAGVLNEAGAALRKKLWGGA